MKPIAVVDETGPKVIARFSTLLEAEEYIANLPNQGEVEKGRYGIDAPEEMTQGEALLAPAEKTAGE